jgi:hypothetical protein
MLCGGLLAQANGSKPQVKVLVYNNARVPDRVLEQGGRQAAKIFQAGGISLAWIDCSHKGGTEQCRVSLDRNQFVLHIVPNGKTSSDLVFGEAFLSDQGIGKYGDVFYDRIEEAHRQAGTGLPELLGAVAAHELGHLLMGLNAHSWMGLMTPIWRPESLRLAGMGNLYFTSQQQARMKARLQGDGTRMTAARRRGEID